MGASARLCLSETPYKHAVRHAVIVKYPNHSHLGEVQSVIENLAYIDTVIKVHFRCTLMTLF